MNYKITHRCVLCGYRWKRVTSDINSPDPPCPRPVKWNKRGRVIATCGKSITPIGMDLTLNKAPASIGGNIHVKAIDETARIVMEDHGMADLRDDVRQGETAEPKLAPAQRQMADAFFGSGKTRANMPVLGMPGVKFGDLRTRPALSASLAMQGAFVDRASTASSIEATHRNRISAPTHIVASDNPRR